MIRIICRRVDWGLAQAGIAKSATEEVVTFDVAAPAVEAWLAKSNHRYEERAILGVEARLAEPASQEVHRG